MLYEEIIKLNLFMSVLLMVAVSMFGAAVRTALTLRNEKIIVNKSVVTFLFDQVLGVCAGFIAWAIIVQWFNELLPLMKLVLIGAAAGMSSEILATAKVGVLDVIRAWIARLTGLNGPIELHITPTQTTEDSNAIGEPNIDTGETQNPVQ